MGTEVASRSELPWWEKISATGEKDSSWVSQFLRNPDCVLTAVGLDELLVASRKLDLARRLEVDVVVAVLACSLPLESREADEPVLALSALQEREDALPLLAHEVAVHLALGAEAPGQLYHLVGVVGQREEVAHAFAVLEPRLELVDLAGVEVEVEVGDVALVVHRAPYMIPVTTMTAATIRMATISLLADHPFLETSR